MIFFWFTYMSIYIFNFIYLDSINVNPLWNPLGYLNRNFPKPPHSKSFKACLFPLRLRHPAWRLWRWCIRKKWVPNHHFQRWNHGCFWFPEFGILWNFLNFAEIDALEEDNMFNESLNQYAGIGKETEKYISKLYLWIGIACFKELMYFHCDILRESMLVRFKLHLCSVGKHGGFNIPTHGRFPGKRCQRNWKTLPRIWAFWCLVSTSGFGYICRVWISWDVMALSFYM